MSEVRGLVILDRDGVINEMVINPDHGLIDSPLHPTQVRLVEGATSAICDLNRMGFLVSVATNQPAFAKGKTTYKNLEATHEKILSLLNSGGAQIHSSHICWHKSEDACSCRKPKTGLLEAAIRQSGLDLRGNMWMVGDGVTDIEAGLALELNTVFLGPLKCDACNCFDGKGIRPHKWFANLRDFVSDFLERN